MHRYGKIILHPDGDVGKFSTLSTSKTRDNELICADVARHDPFQNGDQTTMPTWYVGHQLDMMGVES